jgi:hypothetical protein
MADGHSTAGRPLRPSVGWRTAASSAGRGGGRPGGRPGGPLCLGRPPWAVRHGPSFRSRPPEAVRQGPSAQSKLWRPITIDLEVRFRRLIPFWNVQVMLYNMGYEKLYQKRFFPKILCHWQIGSEVFQCSLWLCIREGYTRVRVYGGLIILSRIKG